MIFRRLSTAGFAAVLISGCSSHAVTPTIQSGPHGTLLPFVVQKQNGPVHWAQFVPHTTSTAYNGIVVGPDKNLWFADYNGKGLVRISMTGAIKEISTSPSCPDQLTVGADHKFYATDPCLGSILQVTMAGSINKFFSPSGDSPPYNGGITLGPDGNVWFVEFSNVASISTSGSITEYTYPDGNTGNSGGIVAGSDGNLWFAESAFKKLDTINPSSGSIVSHVVQQPCQPTGVVAGPDGRIYTACGTYIVAFTTGGTQTSYPNSSGANGTPEDLTIGSDRGIWFASNAGGGLFGELILPSGKVKTYLPPGIGYDPYSIVAGPDGNVWATTATGDIDVYIVKVLDVDPSSLTLSTPGKTGTLSVSELGTRSWSGKSSNKSIATVGHGSSASAFIVTAIAAGRCVVTISDAIGNQANILVTVQ